MRTRFFGPVSLAFFLVLTATCQGQGTQLWKQNRAEDFEKGSSHNVAIRSDGMLSLAPATRLLTNSPSTYIWGLASDREGNALLAAGSPARVYRITPDGKSATLFEGKELEAQAIVAAPNGDVYFATAPDGRVYRVPAPAASPKTPVTPTVFFDPKTKYIWALALDKDKAGDLFIATGDNGEIFKVDSAGKGALFFKSDEAHIRSLAFDPQGNLIAGSDGSGLVYRITPQGQGFVLFSAPKKEVTALAVDAQGNIYAASIGDKHSSGQQHPPASPTSSTGVSGGSELDLIPADGSPTRLWTSKEDLVYSLAFGPRGELLIGTGNRGRIYSVSPKAPARQFTNLLTLSANQVTALLSPGERGTLAATSNLGKLIMIANQPPSEGTFESDVFDAKTSARWGRVEVHGRGKYGIALRTGNVDNPDRNWSNWANAELSGDRPGKAAPDVPPARFAQWRATLYPGAEIDSVAVNYYPRNVAPEIDDVTVAIAPRPTGAPSAERSSAVPGEITVKWSAHDENNDELRYSVFYRGTGEARWILLRENLKEKQLALDPTLFPDGEYQVRVVATDAASHSPEDALTGERVSSYFEVDSTPPRIDSLQAVFDQGALHISFRAADNYSPIKRAEYSIDGGEWQVVEPVGGISDARVETYDFDVLLRPAPQTGNEEALTANKKRSRGKRAPVIPAGPEDHLVVVRAFDRFDNVATAKTVVTGGASVLP